MKLRWHWNPIEWIKNAILLILCLDAWTSAFSFQIFGLHSKKVTCHQCTESRSARRLSSFFSTKMSSDSIDTDSDSFEARDLFDSKVRGSSSWSVTDNWNQLSRSDHINYDNDDEGGNTMMLNSIDQATLAALRMQNFGMSPSPQPVLSKEDLWIQNSIEKIVSTDSFEINADSAAVTSAETFDALDTERFLDDLGNEIALVVRCNDQALSEQTLQDIRRLSPLPIKDSVEQLVTYEFDSHHDMKSNVGNWKATKFLEQAVHVMFQKHVRYMERKWDAVAVASWMTQSLKGTSDGTIGPHDKRVTQTLAVFGKDGFLSEEELLSFYVNTCSCSSGKSSSDKQTWTTSSQLERFHAPEIAAIWRDIRNHGIVTPSELEHRIHQASLLESYSTIGYDPGSTLLDECEILDDEGSSSLKTSVTTDRQGRSSHERVELYRNVPIWLRDGDFVFIDEQSCIGCMQCASVAPGSFQMLEQNGRARAFLQRKSPDVLTAVSTCPVDCMHFVSFDELKKLEIARDVGVADDHRHFGHSADRGYIAPTPLHVSRRDSDANHKSSFYHYMQDKCSKSTNCPQRGCYDCPKFEPGQNPYFQKKLSQATHIRAEYFKNTGTADTYRKTADL